jgi:hypothetical protein
VLCGQEFATIPSWEILYDAHGPSESGVDRDIGGAESGSMARSEERIG